LAVTNLSLSEDAKPIADEICHQLNILYFVSFLIGLVDLRSFYVVYNYATVSTGYSIAFYTTTISLILLVFLINEERHAPAEPVVTDTVSLHSFDRDVIYLLFSTFASFRAECYQVKDGLLSTLNACSAGSM
jgi:hypothetical protein